MEIDQGQDRVCIDLKACRKQILADPIAVYSEQYPDVSTDKLSTLEQHTQKLHSLSDQYDSIKTETGVISGKIGKAKRSGLPIDELKRSMQTCSTRLKSISQEIALIENEILSLFEYEEQSVEDNKSKSSILINRVYQVATTDISNITITKLSDDQGDWNQYLNNHPAASIYHRAEWREVIRDTFGHEGFYYIARGKSGAVAGILPLIRLKSRLFGDFMVSMPYFNYGGTIADHPGIEQRLMLSANEDACRLGVSHIEYRDDVNRADLPVKTDKVNMMLSLPDTHAELWQGFSPKLRAQIRRPQQEKPQIHVGRQELLQDFYTVFAQNMRDLGTPVYSRKFFQNILDRFPRNCWIIVLRLHGRPVAAGFLMGHNEFMEIPWASTLREVNALSMNMLMYWEVLKFAIENGYRQFDFGRSSKDSGTFRFKKQWGALPKQLYWHYWLADGVALPSLNPSNPKYAMMINVWKRLPITLTRWAGPAIVKNLP